MLKEKALWQRVLTGLFLCLIVFSFTSPSRALDASSDGQGTLTLQDYIKDFVDLPEGALDWKILGTTKENKISGVDEEGFDYEYTLPIFDQQVKALDGTTIRIKGFMFPLEESDAQSLFLFGPFPISCPFHYHVGPSLIIEAKPKKPLTFNYDAIVLEGRLELVENDIETGVFYRLHDAKLIK